MRVRLVLGELTEQDAPVLVRVAPPDLVGRTPDVVLAAAGPAVTDACRQLRRRSFPRGVAEAEAITTIAGDLPARWLVHVVVPQWSLRHDRTHLLARSYRSCLQAAEDVAARELVMPALGTTTPYWPLDIAVAVGVGTLLGSDARVTDVRLLVSSPDLLERFAEALARRP